MTTQSDTNPSSGCSSQLSILVEHGSALAQVLRNAKSRSVEGYDNGSDNGTTDKMILCKEAGSVIKRIVGELNEARTRSQGQSLVDESMIYVMDKIQTVIQDLIKLDPTNAAYYDSLATFSKSFHQSSLVTTDSFSLPPPGSSSVPDQQQQQQLVYTLDDLELKHCFDFEAKFSKLTDEEKRCLYCFSLFPEGSEIERELLTYWCAAMNLTNKFANLANEGFLRRIIRSNKVSSGYRIRAGIYSKVIHQAVSQQYWYPTVALLQKAKPSTINGLGNCTPEDIIMLLNIGKHTLDATATTLDCFSGMKKLEVAHLGSWNWDPEYYVVVEDIDFLVKVLKHMEKLRLLSLRGISGIVELPHSMYKLMGDLRVLDLRACHNLEILSDGIDSLQQLTHLDLSECYLLHDIPKGIVKLFKLRVLMGFIVNPVPKNHDQKASSSCEFSQLSELQHLQKLTIRTRRMNFPTQRDIQTLSRLGSLKKLGIA